jgi:hypothetical protein
MLQDICLFCFQYKNPEITRKDVANAIQQYIGLVPMFEPFGKYSSFFFIMDLFICLLVYLFISVRRWKIIHGMILHVEILLLLSFCGNIIIWKNKVKCNFYPCCASLRKAYCYLIFGPVTVKYHLCVFSVYFATHKAWQQAVISSVCVFVRMCDRVHVCEIESRMSIYKVYAEDWSWMVSFLGLILGQIG